MSLDNLDRRRVVWCLAINGLPYRYCSTVAPGSAVDAGRLFDHTATLKQSPTDVVDAILDVGPVDGHIDDMTPVAGQSSVEVRILARDARTAAGVRIDPIETLLRVAGPPSATRRVKLISDLAHAPTRDGPTTVYVASSVAAWTLPGPINIGHEVIWADSFAGNGTIGNLYRFTGVTRGADDWATQAHDVDAPRGEQPWVTSDVTTWRGRHASIHVAALDGAGVAIGWDTYWEGVIDSPPTYDGRAIVVRVAPLTAVAGYKLGVGSASRQTTAVPGAHWIRTGVNGIADRINARTVINITLARFAVSAANGGAGTVTITADAATYLDSIGYPLSATFSVETGVGGVVAAVATSYASPTLSFGAGAQIAVDCAAGLAAGEFVALQANGNFEESYPLQLVNPASGDDQVVAWPGRLVAVIGAAQAYQTVIDSWRRPTPLGGEARSVLMNLNRTAAGTWALFARLVDAGPWGWLGSARVAINRGGRHLRAGWIIADTVGEVRGRSSLDPEAYRYLDYGGGVWQRDGQGNDAAVHEHPGPATWYYQTGEPYVGPFDEDIYTGGDQQIEIKGDTWSTRIWIDGVSADTHPDTGADAYWYSVVDPDTAPDLVVMEGDAPPVAYVVASARNTDPPEYVRRLLNSGVGNGDNGTADVMPIGCNLPHTAIAEGYFNALAAPSSLNGQDYEAIRGKSIAEQCGGLLMACGAQLAQVYSSTLDRWRIAAVHMGPADAARSVLTLTDDDLMVTPGRDPVRVEIDGRTVRSYAVRLNYRIGRGTPQDVPIATSTESNAAGGDSGTPLMLDLPGVEVPGAGGIAQAAAEVVSDIRTRVGMARVRWRLTISASMPGAIKVGLGSVVTLTSVYAIGIDPTTTANATPCRVVGIRRDLMENRIDLEIRPFPASTAGWAQSARVATIVDADSLTVDAAAFSEDDASHFLAGHKVTVFEPGDWAGRAAKTLASVSGTTLNFTAAHGASVGDIIRCDDYATATTAQKAQAFIAAADGTVGSDPGYVLG